MQNSFQDSEKKALNEALKCLSRRQMTVFKLRKRLEEKGFSQKEIEQTINRLLEWKYLDDRSYTVAYIKGRIDKFSKKKTMMGLLGAGIEKELTIKLVDEFYTEDIEYENCMRLAKKFWSEEVSKWERKYSHNPKLKSVPKKILIKKKAGDKLLLRGFLLRTVKAVLTDIAEREDL